MKGVVGALERYRSAITDIGIAGPSGRCILDRFIGEIATFIHPFRLVLLERFQLGIIGRTLEVVRVDRVDACPIRLIGFDIQPPDDALARALDLPTLAEPLSPWRPGPHDKTYVIDSYDAIASSFKIAS